MPDNQPGDMKYVAQARETFQILLEMSKILNTGLDPETLTYCLRLCESGVHPEALATVIKEIKNEVAKCKMSE